MFKLGEVKLPNDEDYEFIGNLCENDQGWTLDYTKNNIKVWTKQNDLSAFNMIRAKAEFNDVSAKLLYNVIQDGEYRETWDTKLDNPVDICYISPCSDIGYFSIKSPKPFKNRDFVTQRCWLDLGDNKDKILFNHSVNHAKYPPKKGFIRALSFISATLIKPTSEKSCILYYVTQSDMGGSLPAWIVNSTTRVIVPKFIKKIYKACLKYEKWKAKHNPDYMPWVNPEQFKMPRIDWNDIISLDRSQLATNAIDESNIAESQIQDNDADDD